MSEIDNAVVGKKLPRLRAVSFHSGYELEVKWDDATRNGGLDVVDLAPLLFRMKFYAPLRENSALLNTVHIINDGSAIAWGADDELDMATTSILRLAEEAMTPADFTAFMKRHDFTFGRVAAELGISPRLAAYYAKERSVPRYIALACHCIDMNGGGIIRGQDAPGRSKALADGQVGLATS